MPVVFPTSLDTATFPSAATLAGQTLTTQPHSKLHDELGQAIVQLEQKVGINSSAVTTSLDYKVAQLATVQIPVGVIMPFGGGTAPANFLMCFGQLVSTTTYAALFAVLGNTYGSGSGTFGMPDLRGRTVIGLDNMGGSAASRVAAASSLGQSSGLATHPLTTGEMPIHTHVQDAHTHTQTSHNHTQNAHEHNINTSYNDVAAGIARIYGVGYQGAGRDSNNTLDINGETATNQATTAVNQNATAVNQNAGSGTAHNNLQPYTALNYIIRY